MAIPVAGGEVQELLTLMISNYYCDSTLRCFPKEIFATSERCHSLLSKDHTVKVLCNSDGSLCTHYPPSLFLSPKCPLEDVCGLIQQAKYARCRTRFVVPSFEFNGRAVKSMIAKHLSEICFKAVQSMIQFDDGGLQMQTRLTQTQDRITRLIGANNEEADSTDQWDDAILELSRLVEVNMTSQQNEWRHLVQSVNESDERVRNIYINKLAELRSEMTDRVITAQRRTEQMNQHRLRLEVELAEVKRKLTEEVKTRRQQLEQVSEARETERRQWALEQAEREASAGRRSEEEIQRLRKEFAEELATLVNGRLGQAHQQYEASMKEVNDRLDESQGRNEALNAALKNSVEEREQLQQSLIQEHETKLKNIENEHRAAVELLKENISKMRTRARTAEASLRKRESKLAELMQQASKKLENPQLLPAEAQKHFEVTIAALRLQVEYLQRKITLMDKEQSCKMAANKPAKRCVREKVFLSQTMNDGNDNGSGDHDHIATSRNHCAVEKYQDNVKQGQSPYQNSIYKVSSRYSAPVEL